MDLTELEEFVLKSLENTSLAFKEEHIKEIKRCNEHILEEHLAAYLDTPEEFATNPDEEELLEKVIDIIKLDISKKYIPTKNSLELVKNVIISMPL